MATIIKELGPYIKVEILERTEETCRRGVDKYYVRIHSRDGSSVTMDESQVKELCVLLEKAKSL